LSVGSGSGISRKVESVLDSFGSPVLVITVLKTDDVMLAGVLSDEGEESKENQSRDNLQLTLNQAIFHSTPANISLYTRQYFTLHQTIFHSTPGNISLYTR
jgi:hypothetical protein